MGFYQTIRNTYGNETTKMMKQWSNLNIKLANFTNRRFFLLRCRSTQIIPKHINDSRKNIHNLLVTGCQTLFTKLITLLVRLVKRYTCLRNKNNL